MTSVDLDAVEALVTQEQPSMMVNCGGIYMPNLLQDTQDY
jgi:hypothetical protein